MKRILGISELLGKVAPKIFLSVVFISVLLQLSLLFRLSGGDRMDLRRGACDTMWIISDVTFSHHPSTSWPEMQPGEMVN